MNTCDTCKWWTGEGTIEGDVLFKACESPFVCRPNYGPNISARADGVLTMDEGGGTNELFTGQKFGCIHHEPK